jgi:hypothetical protein
VTPLTAAELAAHVEDLRGRAEEALRSHFPDTQFEVASSRSHSRPLFIWWVDGPFLGQVQTTLALDQGVGVGLYREPSLLNMMTLAAGRWLSGEVPASADEEVVTFDHRQVDPQLVEFARLVLAAGGVSAAADATYEDLYDAASRAVALGDLSGVLDEIGGSVASAAGLDLEKLAVAWRPAGETTPGPRDRRSHDSTGAAGRSR